MVRAFIHVEAKSKEEAVRIRRENLLGYFPLGAIHYTLWHGFIAYHAVLTGLTLFGLHPAIPAALQNLMDGVNFYAVVIAAPNALRTFCLHFVSSNMHYYGDVEKGNIVQQCQVWTTLWALPLHLFCFNFAGTHAIHHFVVRDPFYIRQWLAPGLYPLLRANGVRFNDIGTFKRANRLQTKAERSAMAMPERAAA
jgi:hypothetical protein